MRSELSRQTLGRNWKQQEAFPPGTVKAESPQRWRGFQALIKPSVETGRRKAVPGPEQIADSQLQGGGGSFWIGLIRSRRKNALI